MALHCTKTCTRTRSAETADASYGRLPRSPGGSAAGEGLRRTPQPRRHRCEARLCGLRTRTRRGGDDGGARRVETRWRGAARGDNRAIVASPGSARMPSHIALQWASLLPCPSGRRWRRRRHRTWEHRRARWRAPPWGTQRRTRHRRMTTVSSTSSFRRRRHRLLRGCQAAGRGTTFGAGCAARRAASAPSPPHLHSTRALSAIDPCCAGTSWPDLGVRAHLLRSARASRRAAKGARRSMANGEMVSSSVLRRAWSRPQRGRRGARARTRCAKKR
jgi:hypothetical protein